MLRIHIDTSQISIFNRKIEKSIYAHVWVTTHPSHSLILTPTANDSPNDKTDYERMEFFTSIMAMADSDNTGTQTAHICHVKDTELANILTYYVAKKNGYIPMPSSAPYPVLCIGIYEESTVGIPAENSDMDFRISNALRISSNFNANKSKLNRELLFSTRIGNVFVPWSDLLSAASKKNGNMTEIILPLFDDRLLYSKGRDNANNIGDASRGIVKLHITSLSNENQIALLNTWIKSSLQKVKLYQEKEIERLELVKTVSNIYVNYYVNSFPDFSMPFAQVKQKFSTNLKTLAYNSETLVDKNNSNKNTTVRINNLVKLVPSTANIGNIHMPTIQSLKGISVPVCYYHLHNTKNEIIGFMHEKYLGDIFDAACSSSNCTTSEIVDCINNKLNNQSAGDPTEERDFLMAMDVITTFLTSIACAGKYRSDYRILRTGGIESLESIDFDRVTGASDSEDCEGVDSVTQETCTIIFNGRSDIGDIPIEIQNDRLWKVLINEKKLIKHNGYWKHPGLSTCQRLLLYYTPISILGSVTDAFPGMSSLREASISDLESAQKAWISNQRMSELYKKIENFIYGTRQNIEAETGAHQYSILMPMSNLLKMYTKGLKLEENRDENGKIILNREKSDQEIVNKIYELDTIFDTTIGGEYGDRLNLPSLILESTCRTSGYIVGASYWANKGPLYESIADYPNSLLVEYEKKQRRWMNTIKEARLMQKNILQAKDTHSMKFVAGDIMEMRRSMFYRDALHFTCRYLYHLLGRSDDAANAMTCSFINGSKNNITWGVPIEQVIRNEPNVCAIPILHRIPYQLRKDFHLLAKEMLIPYLPPVTVGRYSLQDKSFAYPRVISIDELIDILKKIHLEPPASVPKSDFGTFVNDLKSVMSTTDINNNNTTPIHMRIISSRTYSVTLRSATLIGDWTRLFNFLKSQKESIVTLIYQRLVPVFGSQEIIVVTDQKKSVQ